MKKFRTVASVIIMCMAGIVGFFIGAAVEEPMSGAILFSVIAGIACIIYTIDNTDEK
mgnify:FL=1